MSYANAWSDLADRICEFEHILMAYEKEHGTPCLNQLLRVFRDKFSEELGEQMEEKENMG